MDTSADASPVQRALPGAHLVPASPPREERRQASITGPGEANAPPDALPRPPDASARAEAFHEACQEARAEAFPGVAKEEQPAGWADWYVRAVSELGDEGPLREAWRSYLGDDWARSRKPVCPSSAFTSPKVWPRHVPARVAPAASSPGEVPIYPDTPAGAKWRECVEALEGLGAEYALTWLLKAWPEDLVDGELVMRCPDPYMRDWVSQNYANLVDEVACNLGLEGVRWTVAEQGQAASA